MKVSASDIRSGRMYLHTKGFIAGTLSPYRATKALILCASYAVIHAEGDDDQLVRNLLKLVEPRHLPTTLAVVDSFRSAPEHTVEQCDKWAREFGCPNLAAFHEYMLSETGRRELSGIYRQAKAGYIWLAVAACAVLATLTVFTAYMWTR